MESERGHLQPHQRYGQRDERDRPDQVTPSEHDDRPAVVRNMHTPVRFVETDHVNDRLSGFLVMPR